MAGTEPPPLQNLNPEEKNNLELIRPTQGLKIAYDPRIPPDHQKFRFEVAGVKPKGTITWILDGKTLATGQQATYLWPVEKGNHTLQVMISHTLSGKQTLEPVHFQVK